MRRFTAVVLFFALVACANAQSKKDVAPSPSSNPTPVVTAVPATNQDLDKAKRIERDEAVNLVKEGKAVFVDVRAKESYDAGHIKGAVSIPENEIITRLKELPPKKMIITYCA